MPANGIGGSTNHNYIEELKNLVRGFRTSDYINYESIVWELGDIEDREANDDANDLEKEVFRSDVEAARQWLEQSRNRN